MTESSRRPFQSSIMGKIIPSVAAGAVVFGITAVTRQNIIQGVLLSVLVSGIVLLIEFLSEFEESINSLRESQAEGLASFSEATRLYDKVERSPVNREPVDFLLNQVGDLGHDTHLLLVDLVDLEIRRMGRFIKQIHEASNFDGAVQSGAEQPFSIAYPGEDREWLLDLTSVARKCIDAISLSTIDAGVNNYDGGLWTSDLGHRYLDLQRMAIRRGVRIRRIFYFDRPTISQDGVFRGICATQKAIGVDVRTLDEHSLQQASRQAPDAQSLVSDFIVFDDSLAYEMTSAYPLAPEHRPERRITYLSVREERVQDLRGRFERLWDLAHEPDWMEGQVDSLLQADAADEP